MRKSYWKPGVAVLFGICALLPGPVSADDSIPPCWRGGSNTTFQSWVFTVSNNPAAPESLSNPNGTPSATMTIGPFGKGWLATSFGGKTGLWELGQAGQISLAISNYPGFALAPKYFQVQVTYFDSPGIYLAPTVTVPGAVMVSSQTVSNLVAGPGTWRTQISLWSIASAPVSETVLINGSATKGLLVDQIVVDTRIASGGDGDVPAFRPCWRGQAGTTFQHWAFGISNNPAAVPAELMTNPYGVPQASIVVGPFSSEYILEDPFLGCRQGIWDLGRLGTMSLNIPNQPGALATSYKYVQVQVTQLRDGIYLQNAAVSLAGGTLVNEQQQNVETNSFGGVWVVGKTVWRVGPPSPASETVLLTAGTNGSLIDQVVIDTLALDVGCPSNIVTAADTGLCAKTNVTWAVQATDGCVVTNVTSVPPSGSTFPVGTNPVTCIVHDSYGGTRTCNFTVTVIDAEPPQLTCPANLVVARDPAQCGAFVTFAPLATDNCGATTVTSTPPSGSLFPLGLTTVTAIAHDAAGNSSVPCSFTVQVIDFSGDLASFRPCWRGLSGSTFQQWAFSSSNNPAAIPAELATNAYGAPIASIVEGPFSSGYIQADPFLGCRQGIWDLGELGTMSLTVPNQPGASATSYKYVQVAVTQWRDAIYLQNAAVSLTGGTLVSEEQQNTETNGFGGVWVVDKTLWRLGPPSPANEVVMLTAGTNGSLIDQVVIDTLPLDFACPADVAGIADPGLCAKTNVSWPVTAVDGCVVTNVICVPPVGSTFAVGTNPASCVVYDRYGGTRACNFSVVISDEQSPIASCRNISVGLDSNGQAVITGADVDNGSTDNCGIASRSVFPNTFGCGDIGPHQVTLIVTDIHGLTNSCLATVTVQDTLPPTVACPADIFTNATIDCSQVVTWSTPVATDNCSVSNVVSSPPSGSIFAVGTNLVTSTAWDGSGNSNICNFRVIVIPRADLSVSISGNPNPATLGSNVVYTVTVSNAGPCLATAVVLSNLFSSGQAVLTLTNGNAPGMACPQPGPMAWWRAEGNATDGAGANDGIASPGLAYAAGIVGQAFDFDGTTGNVAVADSPSLRPQSLTVEGWIKLHDVTGIHVVIGKRLGTNTADSYSMWIGSGILFSSVSDTNGSGPFMTFPEFPRSSVFTESDIIDLQSFAYLLQPAVPADPVSQFIKSNLSPATANLLATYAGGPDLPLLQALIGDLNIIIASGSIYTSPRFAGVTLSPESQYILGRNPTGPDLVRLNRYLIRDAYPADFAPTVFPQLNQWFHVAYTFDSPSQSQALYVNGALVNAGYVNKTIDYDGHPVYIGADDNNGFPGYFYQGEIDEMTLYDRALTGAEIQAIYGAGGGGKCVTPSGISLGSLASGATTQLSLTSLPIACSSIAATVTVSSAVSDPLLLDNAASASLAVQDLPPDQWRLSIERVSFNNNLLRIELPYTCVTSTLESTTNLLAPIIWGPVLAPVELLNNHKSVIVPADKELEFFRMKTP